MIYQCIKCLKFFSYKTNYLNHLGRKIPCKENKLLIEDQSEINKLEETLMSPNDTKCEKTEILDKKNIKNECLICHKIYRDRSGLYKHKKLKHPNYDKDITEIKNRELTEIDKLKEIFIKETQNNKEKIDKLIKDLDEKNKQLENIMKTSKSKTINNITNYNGIINNITIVAFGKEDISLLNKDEIYKILYDKNYDPLIASIETIHFNERLPQYQNIKLKDIKSKYIDIHNGLSWQKKNKNNIIDETLDNHIYNIKTLKDENNDAKIKKSVTRLVDKYDQYYDIESEEKTQINNKKLIKEIEKQKDNIFLAIHNKVNDITLV